MCRRPLCRSTGRRIITQIHVVKERHRTISTLCSDSYRNNHNFYLITLNVYEKRAENSYDVISLNGRMTRHMMRKCILFDAREREKVQTLVMCLSVSKPVV